MGMQKTLFVSTKVRIGMRLARTKYKFFLNCRLASPTQSFSFQVVIVSQPLSSRMMWHGVLTFDHLGLAGKSCMLSKNITLLLFVAFHRALTKLHLHKQKSVPGFFSHHILQCSTFSNAKCTTVHLRRKDILAATWRNLQYHLPFQIEHAIILKIFHIFIINVPCIQFAVNLNTQFKHHNKEKMLNVT